MCSGMVYQSYWNLFPHQQCLNLDHSASLTQHVEHPTSTVILGFPEILTGASIDNIAGTAHVLLIRFVDSRQRFQIDL